MKIELSLQKRLARVAKSMITATSNSPVLQAYYSKFLASNLKNILKGLALERSYEEISRFVDLYVEELVGTRDIIVRALASKRLDEAVSTLRTTEFGEAAEAAIKAFLETKNFQVIDLYIDRAYYRNLLQGFLSERKDKRDLRELIALDIDAYNVTTVLRAREWGLQPGDAEQLICGARVQGPERRFWSRLLVPRARVNQSHSLTAHPTSGIVSQQDTSNPAWISVLEGNFEALKFRAARRTFTWDIFSISEALGILRLLEYEIRALSAVAFGIEQRITRSEIMQSLAWFKED